MQRDILSAIGLALSMFGGVLLTIVSLLYRPSFAEYSALRVLLGALAGAVAWKLGQRWWQRRREQRSSAGAESPFDPQRTL